MLKRYFDDSILQTIIMFDQNILNLAGKSMLTLVLAIRCRKKSLNLNFNRTHREGSIRGTNEFAERNPTL